MKDVLWFSFFDLLIFFFDLEESMAFTFSVDEEAELEEVVVGEFFLFVIVIFFSFLIFFLSLS
jgi:hypothetical protein